MAPPSSHSSDVATTFPQVQQLHAMCDRRPYTTIPLRQAVVHCFLLTVMSTTGSRDRNPHEDLSVASTIHIQATAEWDLGVAATPATTVASSTASYELQSRSSPSSSMRAYVLGSSKHIGTLIDFLTSDACTSDRLKVWLSLATMDGFDLFGSL